MDKKYIPVFIIIITVIITLLTITFKPEELNKKAPSTNNTNNTTNYSYVKIDNVVYTMNSYSSACTGTITIKENSPYKYRYIKVKASFINYSGKTIDTDWTYAVDSVWLDPGESKTFTIRIDDNYEIDDCKLTIMEE